MIRVKKSTKICLAGVWQKLHTLRFPGNTRRRPLGQVLYSTGDPTAVGHDESEAGSAGQVGIWYLAANQPCTATQAVAEYAHRPGCEAGFRDAQWWLGFAQARIKQITAWSRLFALVAIALLVVVSLATRLLLRGDKQARTLLRRVVSRRRGRCELSLVSAMISLLQQDPELYRPSCPWDQAQARQGFSKSVLTSGPTPKIRYKVPRSPQVALHSTQYCWRISLLWESR